MPRNFVCRLQSLFVCRVQGFFLGGCVDILFTVGIFVLCSVRIHFLCRVGRDCNLCQESEFILFAVHFIFRDEQLSVICG